ncbi:MAG: carboxymuconolactone decarboxylase family protein [Alphaproteobacteria bacterium]|nr:carboxymuconolactone decarboxylase family protein [Alphaproteobacteria bacterium]
MARVPYPDPTHLSPETREVLGKMPPLNIFRMMAGGEGLLKAFTRMGNYLLFKSKLDPILREIAIIRAGVLSKATYEVHQHERIGRDLGMSDALIKAIHAGPDDAGFNELQRLVMRYTDDVVRNVRAGDATFAPLSERLSLQEMQELTVTIGYYMMVSRFLETFDVDIEQTGTKGVSFPDSQKRSS